MKAEMAEAIGLRNVPAVVLANRPSAFVRSQRLARRKPLGAFGLLVIGALVVAAAFPGLIARDSPTIVPLTDLASQRLQAPSTDHFMGTDDQGRDIFSRIVHGSRLSLEVGIVSVAIAAALGTLAGLVSGYVGGRTDSLIQRLVDTLIAFPGLVLALAIVGLLGSEVRNVMIAVGIISAPGFARVVRGSVLVVMNEPYIEAARTVGASDARLIFLHVLPNVMAPIIVLATAGLGSAILIEASLSFLGFGVAPPAPSWGRMLAAEGRLYMVSGAWWMAVFPGVAITVAVLGFNLLGDALRDILDPRLRGSF